MLAAVAQMEPKLGEVSRNLEAIVARMQEASAQGADLIVLPECVVTGYVFDSPAEALASAQEMPGPALETLESACAELGVYAVCGVLVREGDELRNRSLLIGPDGLLASYNKTHLPYLGVDRFVTAGTEPLVPVDTPIGRIGLMICYDLRFPRRCARSRCVAPTWSPTRQPGQWLRARTRSSSRSRARTRTSSTS